MASLQSLTINDTGYLRIPIGTTAQRPGSPVAGMMRYNSDYSVNEYYDGNYWIPQSYSILIGTSAQQILADYPNATSNYYLIKPAGYSGSPFSVFCDMTGNESGIGTSGWMAIKYAEDKYSESSPWSNTGNSDQTNPPYSGDFSFILSTNEIQSLLDTTSESRQKLPSYGRGSVGWTYNGGSYQGAKAFDNSLHRSISATENSNLILGANSPSSISYGFTDITSFTNTGTDPTDANDQVWRNGTIYLRETTTRQYLPIRGIYNADVDTTDEQRYFPLVSENGITWVK